MKKNSLLFYLGLAMTVIGVFLFFTIVRVGDFSFTHEVIPLYSNNLSGSMSAASFCC